MQFLRNHWLEIIVGLCVLGFFDIKIFLGFLFVYIVWKFDAIRRHIAVTTFVEDTKITAISKKLDVTESDVKETFDGQGSIDDWRKLK